VVRSAVSDQSEWTKASNPDLDNVQTSSHHITVCVCTYQRPHLLGRLLRELSAQNTAGLFTYSIVVVDNDSLESANAVVSAFAAVSAVPVKYCVEPTQGIALARNRAVENAEGELIAFIDDDEFPGNEWLLTLFRALETYNVAGVLGPVRRHFDECPPKWILRGQFFIRPSHSTGYVMDWRETRTGNVLFHRRILASVSPIFRAELRSGEDVDFFRRMMSLGHSFVWCDEAPVFETVPPARWRRSYMLRRALLRGRGAALRHEGLAMAMKSLIAVPAYALSLPVACLLGHHVFMLLLIKLCDHLGKLLTLAGITVIKDPYVTV